MPRRTTLRHVNSLHCCTALPCPNSRANKRDYGRTIYRGKKQNCSQRRGRLGPTRRKYTRLEAARYSWLVCAPTINHHHHSPPATAHQNYNYLSSPLLFSISHLTHIPQSGEYIRIYCNLFTAFIYCLNISSRGLPFNCARVTYLLQPFTPTHPAALMSIPQPPPILVTTVNNPQSYRVMDLYPLLRINVDNFFCLDCRQRRSSRDVLADRLTPSSGFRCTHTNESKPFLAEFFGCGWLSV